jgi:hypothetical protein
MSFYPIESSIENHNEIQSIQLQQQKCETAKILFVCCFEKVF